VKALEEWARQHGVVAQKVRIGSCKVAGNGLFATEVIEEGELLVTVPDSLMMTTVSAKKSRLGSVLAADPVVGGQSSLLLAIHLLEEMLDKRSYWAKYIGMHGPPRLVAMCWPFSLPDARVRAADALPRTYTTPLFWTTEQVALLNGTVVQGKCLHFAPALPAPAMGTSINSYLLGRRVHWAGADHCTAICLSVPPGCQGAAAGGAAGVAGVPVGGSGRDDAPKPGA
jgi:hypothetical protein